MQTIDPSYVHKSLMFSVAVLILFPMFLTFFAPVAVNGVNEDELMEGYERMTGQAGQTKISVWPLAGIYTPYTGSYWDPDANEGQGQTITYGYTEDGWLYGTSVSSYSPYQYQDTPLMYSVYKAPDGVYRYWSDSKDYNKDLGTGHQGRVVETIDGKETVTYYGDLYTDVSFDMLQKSDIFFVESSRQEDANGHFKYDYTGYRYAFQPISNYTAIDQDGNSKPIIATTTSLSLIWYVYAGQSGISGQLVLSGSNGGLAYINSAQILSAFNSYNSTAAFDMVFNGVKMTIYIKIDPHYLNQGISVEDCYNGGHWSIMVTSLSSDSSAYLGTDYSKDPTKIIETVWNLLTFDMSDYNMSPWLQELCSIVFYMPFYITMITLLLTGVTQIWILLGILAAIEAVSYIWPF